MVGSDSESYNLLKHVGVDTVIVAGGSLNQCVVMQTWGMSRLKELGFNIIVALAKTLEGPWSLTTDDDNDNMTISTPSSPAVHSVVPSSVSSAASSSSLHGPCAAPQRGYCARAHATPTHSSAGVLGDGKWPAGVSTLAAAEIAVGKICDANAKCAAFGLGTDKKVENSYQLYSASPVRSDSTTTILLFVSTFFSNR